MLANDSLSAASITGGSPSIMRGASTALSSSPSTGASPSDASGLVLQPMSASQAGAAAPAPEGAVLHVGAGQTYATIQAAVNAAHDGDTIVVNSGVYHEQVTMDGLSNVTVEAANGAAVIIEAPASLAENGDGVTAVFAVENGANNVLRNITINGDGAGDGVSGAYVGVYYQDASGGTENVNVFGVRGGGPGGTITGAQGTGYAVKVVNDAGGDRLGFTMTGGSITDFQKGGLNITHADVDISGLSISGAGATTINAQNGAVFFDSSGSVHDNFINELGFTRDDTATAVGVLAFDSTDFHVTGNTIAGGDSDPSVINNFVGVDLEGSVLTTGEITGNTISHVNEAIVGYGDFGAFTISDNDVSDVTAYDPGIPGYGVDFTADAGVTASLIIHGTAGNDAIYTALGDDTLSGGTGGDDTLAGGQGNDSYYVDTYSVTVTEASGEGHDTVYASVSYTLGADVEDLTLTGTSELTGVGNTLDNLITGNSDTNTLMGGKGADTLVGGGNTDKVYGGAGNDTLVSLGDGDVLNGGKGADVFAFTDLLRVNSAQIIGFETGETLDLSALPGTLTQVGAFGRHAGEFTVTYDAAHDRTLVNFDLDGDKHVDHRIAINGDFSHAGDITFVL